MATLCSFCPFLHALVSFSGAFHCLLYICSTQIVDQPAFKLSTGRARWLMQVYSPVSGASQIFGARFWGFTHAFFTVLVWWEADQVCWDACWGQWWGLGSASHFCLRPRAGRWWLIARDTLRASYWLFYRWHSQTHTSDRNSERKPSFLEQSLCFILALPFTSIWLCKLRELRGRRDCGRASCLFSLESFLLGSQFWTVTALDLFVIFWT